MRMAHTITLVLLGGGVVLGGAAMMMPSPGPSLRRECQEARAQARPDVEQICASATSSSTRSGGYHFIGMTGSGSSRGPALAGAAGFRGDPSASSRGGFGGIGRAFSSSGG